ncbi:MAG: AraC family transcriptional regulator [Oscillospiraceae bacterium]|nr:AraC family transcriptional regulator [Oscillospiraceae bacterium]
MLIGSIGYNHSHDSDFVMNCPQGPGCYLFLLIKTPAIFVTGSKKYKVRENSFIIISPAMPCRYYASEEKYTDDWFYFHITDKEKDDFTKNGIIFDEPLYLGNIEELSRLIHIMSYEHYLADVFHSEIEHKYADILIMKIGRIIQTQEFTALRTFTEKNSRLTYLRTRIYSTPECFASIDSMMDLTGMSRSALQHAYKKTFGVSIITDVINSRISSAKKFLVSTDLSVCEIAEKCGYGCEYSFLRQFKKMCGCTPTQYRKSKN